MHKLMKHVLDIGIAAMCFVLLCWLLVLIALLIRVTLGNPIFFTQLRPGLHGKHFKIYKF